jgi:Rrf2 family cysteine metabolism transcriptional repressor
MKFSSRAIYGMRAMLALARTHGRGSTFLKEIVERENLPGTYLEQLMVPLRKAGIVQAVRGAKGGYTLARSPAEITVLSILEALEGPLNLADCPSGSGCCGQPDTCALQELWAEGSRALDGIYRNLSLATLLERQRAKETDPAMHYSI